MSENKLSTKEKADLITSNILEARKWGIDLFLPNESIQKDGYQLWVNHDTPDIVVVFCSYDGVFEVNVPGFEATTGDFSSMVALLDTLLSEISY